MELTDETFPFKYIHEDYMHRFGRFALSTKQSHIIGAGILIMKTANNKETTLSQVTENFTADVCLAYTEFDYNHLILIRGSHS